MASAGLFQPQNPSRLLVSLPCFHVELPGLQNLSLDGYLPAYLPNPATAVDYVLQYNAELTILRLTVARFSFAEVNDLFNGFAAESKLRKLHISKVNFSPDLLRFLSTGLPDLRDLTITFGSLTFHEKVQRFPWTLKREQKR
jgi:hypothetical protein